MYSLKIVEDISAFCLGHEDLEAHLEGWLRFTWPRLIQIHRSSSKNQRFAYGAIWWTSMLT